MQKVAINFAKLILCNNDEQCEVKVSTLNHPDFMYVSSEETTIKRKDRTTCSSYESTTDRR